MRRIRIEAAGVEAAAQLDEGVTADRIWEALPLRATANLWGDEIYAPIPVQMGEAQDARRVLQVGDIAFGPSSGALCIFFGRTPASTDDRPQAANPVNVFGHIEGDASIFRRVKPGTSIRVERAEE